MSDKRVQIVLKRQNVVELLSYIKRGQEWYYEPPTWMEEVVKASKKALK